MALIYPGIKCSICGEPIGERRLVATTHFIGDQSDPLWRFSDSAMHYDCFQTWPHRAEFAEKYNSTIGRMVWGNGTRHHMRADGVVESVPAAG
jgi:hypothetical protein